MIASTLPDLSEVAYNFTISGVGDRYDHREDTNYYMQPGNLFRLMTPDQKARLIDNLVQDMKPVSRDVQIRQLKHFYAADPAYGESVAQGIGIDIREVTG